MGLGLYALTCLSIRSSFYQFCICCVVHSFFPCLTSYRYDSHRLVAKLIAGYVLIYLDLKPYFLMYNHTVFYTTEGGGDMGDRESFTPVGRGITLYVRGLLSLRKHPVFSALVSPAEKNFSEGEKRRPEIRLRFSC